MDSQEMMKVMQGLFPGWELEDLSQAKKRHETSFVLIKMSGVNYPGAAPVKLLIWVNKTAIGAWAIEFRDSGRSCEPMFEGINRDPRRAIALFVAQFNAHMLRPITEDSLDEVMGSDATSQGLWQVWETITWNNKFLDVRPRNFKAIVHVFWHFASEDIEKAKAYFASTRERDDLCPPEDILTRSAYWASYPCGECIVVTEERWIETNEEY